MPRTIENLSGTDALVRVLTAAEGHTLPVPELIERALPLQGWKKNKQGGWEHPTLKGKSPGATLAAQAYTGSSFIKVSKGVVRLRVESDSPYEREPYARALTLEEARAAVETAAERLAKAKANLKEIEKAALVAGEEGGSKA